MVGMLKDFAFRKFKSSSYKEKTTGGAMYSLAVISFFGGAFLSYSFGYMSFLLEMSVLIGLVLAIVFGLNKIPYNFVMDQGC